MKITEEMLAEDEKKWGNRDILTELKYCGNNMRDRKIMTNNDIRFYAYIMRKAYYMLKEKEPIKPTVSVDTWVCSKCGHTLESQELIDDKENPQVLVHELYEYCPACGQAVKWE